MLLKKHGDWLLWQPTRTLKVPGKDRPVPKGAIAGLKIN